MVRCAVGIELKAGEELSNNKTEEESQDKQASRCYQFEDMEEFHFVATREGECRNGKDQRSDQTGYPNVKGRDSKVVV